MKTVLKILCVTLALLLVSCAPNAAGQPLSRTVEGYLDTISTITLYDGQNRRALDSAEACLADVDTRMSSHSDKSELSKLSGAQGAPVRVSADVYDLVRFSVQLAAQTDGAFDITVDPVAKLWGIGTESARVPQAEEIARALTCVDYRNIVIGASPELSLHKPSISVDLGAIAKGYACDAVVGQLRADGVTRAVVDLGGNIFAMGTRDNGEPWRVGIRSPERDSGGLIGVVRVADRSVVTSATNERFMIEGETVYHHIFDPHTGYPADNGLTSVTIVGPSSMHCDALSTACFVLGAEKGAALLRRGVTFDGLRVEAEAIFITSDKRVLVTDGLKSSFELTDRAYTLADIP